ncbi:toxin [Abyssogena phaseoliformis symbiont]|uniref:toxin n=1 Tax=Abyssogena phaseoliformis symbiont TaxID=596095 RepID=UPI001CEC78AE|nr:toxin [Abyssogena phaseoliformis symbiont]
MKKTRDISFEKIVMHIESGDLIDIIQHLNDKKYVNQKILIIDVNNYVYTVPCVINNNEWFFKTIMPNRQFIKKYLGDKNETR